MVNTYYFQTKHATITARQRSSNVNEMSVGKHYVEVRVKLGEVDYAIDMTEDEARELASGLNSCADVVGIRNSKKG